MSKSEDLKLKSDAKVRQDVSADLVKKQILKSLPKIREMLLSQIDEYFSSGAVYASQVSPFPVRDSCMYRKTLDRLVRCLETDGYEYLNECVFHNSLLSGAFVVEFMLTSEDMFSAYTSDEYAFSALRNILCSAVADLGTSNILKEVLPEGIITREYAVSRLAKNPHYAGNFKEYAANAGI